MEQNKNTIAQITDHLFRHQAGKMVAVLVRIFGTEHLALAEDVVQDTLLQAMEVWKLKGLPEKPEAWLHRVARNKAIDIIRHNKFSVQYDFNDSDRVLLQSEYTLSTAMDTFWTDDVMNDDLLRMMYACCHPDLAEENQIALILKTLCGFSVAEIARAFLSSEDTIAKRLYRTREFFRLRKLRPEFPPTPEIKGRTNAVLKTIYLIFNEGYNATHAETHIRKELLDQAIYLCGLLCSNHHTQQPEVYAAMALMHLHAARIDSRVAIDGEIILLAEQDRNLWDRAMIEQGRTWLEKASGGDSVSSYHVEAAIAFEHCIAQRFEDTNWERILFFYEILTTIYPTSIVQLNKMMVYYKINGGAKTLEAIEQYAGKEEWSKHYLYHSLLGEIYTTSDKEKARASYERAIQLTQSAAEQKLLHKKIRNLL